MRNYLGLLIICLVLVGCGSSKGKKKKASKSKPTVTRTHTTKGSKTINSIINYAQSFEGTRYKYGGTTKKGMDCSGLVHTAFQRENISLPRTTSALKTEGTWIDVKKVKKGDLLFFATKKNSRQINHVGIVTNARPGFVEFIHSTSSRGVITSNLSERYWYLAYVQARRII